MTVYEAYGGVLGNLLLKPTWATTVSGEEDDASCAIRPETEQAIHYWCHAVISFVKSHSEDAKLD